MERSEAVQTGLDHAARLLMAVGCNASAEPKAAMLALSAADHLRQAGAVVLPLTVTDARAALVEALQTLAELPDDVFGENAVADAVDDAQDALATTSGR